MDDGYGIEKPEAHHSEPRRAPARFLVLIASGSGEVAKLFAANRALSEEIDAATEQVVEMTRGLTPTHGALDAEWDRALAGHSAEERAAAEVYTLDL